MEKDNSIQIMKAAIKNHSMISPNNIYGISQITVKGHDYQRCVKSMASSFQVYSIYFFDTIFQKASFQAESDNIT